MQPRTSKRPRSLATMVIAIAVTMASVPSRNSVEARWPTPRETAPAPRQKRLTEAEITKLLASLGDDDFQIREAATETLKRRPEAAMAILRTHRTTTNPETRQRIETILPVMMNREGAERRLARLPEYAKNYQLDHLVQTMVLHREFVTPEHEKVLRAFVKQLYDDAAKGKKFDAAETVTNLFTAHEQMDYPATPLFEATTGAPVRQWVAASEKVQGGVALQDIIVCTGHVEVRNVNRSIVISTGSVRIGTAAEGEFGIGDADASAIICLGDLFVAGGESDLVVCGGQTYSYYTGTTITATGSNIRTGDTASFCKWNLYSASSIGTQLWSLFGVVGVRTIAPDSAVSRVGLKPGDLILQIDGTPIRTTREANRQLCRATVLWGAGELTVQRATTRHEIILPLADW